MTIEYVEPGAALSTNETSSMPSGCSTTEIWPNSDRSSRSRSRRSSRSLGMSPEVTKRRIESLSCGDLAGDLRDLAARVAGAGRAGQVGVLGGRLVAGQRDLVVQGLERAGQRARGLGDVLLERGVLGVAGQLRPRVPEPRELLVEAVLAGLVERQLGAVERLGARRPLLQVGVLGAVLEVDELVADAAVGLDVDARAEVRAGAADDAAGRDLRARRRRRARPPGASSPWSTRWRCCGRRCPAGAAGRAGRAATSGVRRRRRSTRLGLEVEDAVDGRGGRLGRAGRRAGRSRPRARGR